MTREMMEIQKKELKDIEDIRDKFGETIYDCIQEEYNSTSDIGKYALDAIMECKTGRELELVEKMLAAITGYNIDSILEKIRALDGEGYAWESL